MNLPSLRPRDQAGFTLAELMISMLLGLLSIGAVLKMYQVNGQTYRTQTAVSALQQSARYAFDLLSYELRMAGFTGCSNLDVVTPNVLATSAPAWPANEVGQRIAGSEGASGATDTLSIARGSGCGAQLTTAMSSASDILRAEDASLCNWSAGALLMVTDCEAVDVFEATSISTASGSTHISHAASANTSASFSKAFGTEAQVMSLELNNFSIATAPSGEPALFRNGEPVVEGIENLQIRYGIDTNADRAVDQYVAANAVTDWSSVLSVEINLLLRTAQDNLAPEPQTYVFAGTETTATDRRLRRAYTHVVTLRNRVI